MSEFINSLKSFLFTSFCFSLSIALHYAVIKIHLLIKFKPRYSIEQVVRRLKQVSTYNIWLENEEYLKKFYWSGKHKLWTNGYFCSTIGDVSEPTLLNYINNQG